MRDPDVIVSDIAALDDVIAVFGDPDGLDEYPAAQFSRDALLEHRRRLLNELGEAELGAVALILDGDMVGRGEIDVSLLVDTLSPFQDVVSSIGQVIQAEPTSRSSIPEAIRGQTRMRLTGTFDGSMGLMLHGPRQDQEALFDAHRDGAEVIPPVFERAVERTIDLLESARLSFDAGHDDTDVAEHLAGLGSRTFAHLKRLASAISTNDARARIIFQRPHGAARMTMVSKASADRIQKILTSIETDERELKMQGRLVGASLVRDNFELAREDGSVISGKVHPETLPFLRGYFDTDCTVTLLAHRTRTTVSDVENERYTLIHITDA